MNSVPLHQPVYNDVEAVLNFQQNQIHSSFQYPSVITDPELKPIVLDQLPSKLNIINFKKNYKSISCIGTGSFGTVKLCKKMNSNTINYPYSMMDNSRVSYHDNYYNNCNKLVAVKIMMTRLDNLSSYARVRELKFILNIPQHKNLLTVYECFIDDETYKLHIALEVMDQNLYQLIKFRINKGSGLFSHSTLQSILSQILSGIYHIHSNGFFHRDLKPENILISTTFKYYDKEYFQSLKPRQNYVVKIADYGLSRHITPNSNHFTAYVSTRWYRSPEILLRDRKYCKPIDIWAFGCVAFECTTFTPLFPGSDEMDQIWKILELLGTPFLTKENEKTGYIPNGGVWEESRKLINNLNIQFPYIEGCDISQRALPMIIDSPAYKKPNSSDIYSKLCEVMRKCLTWSPHERVTVEQLTQMAYFQNTDVCLEHQNKVAQEKQLLQLEQQYFYQNPTSALFSGLGSVDKIFSSPKKLKTPLKTQRPTEGSKKIAISKNISKLSQFDLSFDKSFKNKYNSSVDYENSFFDLYNSGITKENSELSIGAGDMQKQDSINRAESPLSSINFTDYNNSSSNYILQKVSINDTSFNTDTSFNSNPKSFIKHKSSNQESKKVTKQMKEKQNSIIKTNVFNSGNFIINEND
ncbi:hypothetical protein ACO0SA_003037 [Hanseniaspora valbyensis]